MSHNMPVYSHTLQLGNTTIEVLSLEPSGEWDYGMFTADDPVGYIAPPTNSIEKEV